MASVHEITSLVQHPIKPTSWRVLQSIDSSYSLEFSFLDDIQTTPEFLPVKTRDLKIKNYKSIKAVFNDIIKVQQQAVIHFETTIVG